MFSLDLDMAIMISLLLEYGQKKDMCNTYASLFKNCSTTVVPGSPYCSLPPHPPPAPTVDPQPVVHVHGSFIPVS